MNPKMRNNNKKKASNKSKEADPNPINGAKSWPNLPPKLIEMISWDPKLMLDIGYGGITKSWRTPTKQCHNPSVSHLPWLDLINEGSCFRDTCSEFGISFHQGEWQWRYQRPMKTPWKYYVGYSNGALIAKGESSTDYYFHVPRVYWDTMSQFPEWDPKVPFATAVLLSTTMMDKRIRSCDFIVLTGISHPVFVFGKENKWVKQDCTIVDPHCPRQKSMRFTNGIGHDGKLYALSSQGTLVILETDKLTSTPKIIAFGRNQAVPSVPSKYFKEFLLRSDLEILLVFLISKKSINTADDVEVFKLNIDELTWVKMKGLVDRTLFLGTDNCMSVHSSKVGCKSNCVYFACKSAESWWEYELESGNITLRSSDEILPRNISFRPEIVDAEQIWNSYR